MEGVGGQSVRRRLDLVCRCGSGIYLGFMRCFVCTVVPVVRWQVPWIILKNIMDNPYNHRWACHNTVVRFDSNGNSWQGQPPSPKATAYQKQVSTPVGMSARINNSSAALSFHSKSSCPFATRRAQTKPIKISSRKRRASTKARRL
jgi:hypothetical protein